MIFAKRDVAGRSSPHSVLRADITALRLTCRTCSGNNKGRVVTGVSVPGSDVLELRGQVIVVKIFFF
ncbi:hypothetical protein, partial [Burkholderia sp. Ac-20384]|uniref:hypothetical protein n=1 Tax=Burkholderia sp. Ac-20384 TaxID=2703902 RepID=UPI00197FF055